MAAELLLFRGDDRESALAAPANEGTGTVQVAVVAREQEDRDEEARAGAPKARRIRPACSSRRPSRAARLRSCSRARARNAWACCATSSMRIPSSTRCSRSARAGRDSCIRQRPQRRRTRLRRRLRSPIRASRSPRSAWPALRWPSSCNGTVSSRTCWRDTAMASLSRCASPARCRESSLLESVRAPRPAHPRGNRAARTIPGTMAAVAADPATTAAHLAGLEGVVIANENSPEQSVISGPTRGVQRGGRALARGEHRGAADSGRVRVPQPARARTHAMRLRAISPKSTWHAPDAARLLEHDGGALSGRARRDSRAARGAHRQAGALRPGNRSDVRRRRPRIRRSGPRPRADRSRRDGSSASGRTRRSRAIGPVKTASSRSCWRSRSWPCAACRSGSRRPLPAPRLVALVFGLDGACGAPSLPHRIDRRALAGPLSGRRPRSLGRFGRFWRLFLALRVRAPEHEHLADMLHGCAVERFARLASIASRASRSSPRTRTLTRSCARSARSISCSTAGVRPWWPTVTTGSR